MRFSFLTTMNWRLLSSRISYHAIWLTKINVLWVKMEALGSSETFASLHSVISHNTKNIQMAIVNLNRNKSIGLRRGEGYVHCVRKELNFYILFTWISNLTVRVMTRAVSRCLSPRRPKGAFTRCLFVQLEACG